MKILSILLSILLMAQYALAAPVGKITYTEGRVDLIKAGADMGIPMREGDEVTVGDEVRTKSNSKAEIAFEDGTVLRLAQNSKINIKEYQLSDNKARKSAAIMLARGKARTIIAKMPDASEFIISTPNAQGKVKGSDIFTSYQAGSSGMLVAEGKLSVSNVLNPQQTVVVPAGSSILVPFDETPKEPRAYLEIEKKLYEADTSIPPRTRVEGGVIKGVITKLAGNVRITKRGEASSHQASINETLSEGDKVETGADGMIEIRFDNGNAMSLKPDSNITIATLVFNPQTGEYENLFESTAGRLKARIENLKGKSKFEVRTPSSICGARGTIMYVSILAGVTQAFFEGGDGYITNLISDITQIIGMGENAYSDDQGNISNPNFTPTDLRSSFSEGWEPGSGGEGYSAPERSPLGGYPPAPTRPAIISPTGTGGLPSFADLPFSPLGSTIPPAVSLSADGSFLGDETSSISASITSLKTAIEMEEIPPSGSFVTSLMGWHGKEYFLVNGSYSNPGGATRYSADVEGTGVGGEAVKGWFGGSWHSWEGLLSALYLQPAADPEGNTGYLAGTMIGYMNGPAASGSFTGIGEVSITPITETEILPTDLNTSMTTTALPAGSTLYCGFDAAAGYLDMSFDRSTINITGEQWGIYKDTHTGVYRNPNALTDWEVWAGGGYGDSGYHFNKIEGMPDPENGVLNLNILEGYYLDYHSLGEYYGSVLGIYSDAAEGNFSSIGLGDYSERAISSSGSFLASLYNNGILTGSLSGLIGTTAWDEPMLSIGTFTRNIVDPFIWFSDSNKGIYTYNPDNVTYTTYDGWAFAGITAGYGIGDSLTGRMLALGMSPDGITGVFTAELSGLCSAASGAYKLDGDILSRQVASTAQITVAELYDSVFATGGAGKISGSFAGGGSLTADESFTTMSIASGTTAQLWGIYGQAFSGAFSSAAAAWTATMGGHDAIGVYYSEAAGGFVDDLGYWLAPVAGDDWGGGVFSATTPIPGTFLTYTKKGVMAGDLFGIYDTAAGTWQGVGFGEWSADTLSLSGVVGDGNSPLLYYSEGEYLMRGGTFEGLIGSLTLPWDGATTFTGMGQYSSEAAGPFIFNAPTYSYNATNLAYTNLGGGAFYGYSSGLWDAVGINGRFTGIYVDPEGNIGYLKTLISGNSYSGLNLWTASGIFEEPVVKISAAESFLDGAGQFYDAIWETERRRSAQGSISGSFSGSGNIDGLNYFYTLSLVDYENNLALPWGVYSHVLFGDFLKPGEGTGWSAIAGGNNAFGAYYNNGAQSFYDDTGYWIADITNGSWGDGRLFADVAGTFLTGTKTGSFSGGISGTQQAESRLFQAAGNGTYEGTPLTFTGTWGWSVAVGSLEGQGTFSSTYYNDNGSIQTAGHDTGLIGATSSPWSSSAQFLAMGSYTDSHSNLPHIWNTSISSYNAPAANSTTLDGGAFYGFTGGIWKNNIMDGAMVALYAAPTDKGGVYNTGVLKGSVAGSYYPDISMWGTVSTVLPEQLSADVELDPAYFNKSIDEDVISNNGLYGYFGNGGSNENNYIRGYQKSGYSYSIGEEPWGIFDITLGDKNTYSNSTGSTSWAAVTGGIDVDKEESSASYWFADLSGNWQNGEIRAAVTGTTLSDGSLGVISGGLFGISDEDSKTWISAIIGNYKDTPLYFNGELKNFAPEENGAFGYYDNSKWEVALDYGSIKGLFGVITSPWTGSPDITLMGEFSNSESYDLWGVDLSGETIDGGKILGVVGGTALNDSLKGLLHAIYIRPVGDGEYRAGYITSSDIAGTFYPGTLNMFRTEKGIITSYLDLPTKFSPEQLFGEDGLGPAVESGEFGGNIAGDVQGGVSGESIHIMDQAWGLWRAGLGGAFTAGSMSDEWYADVGGTDTDDNDKNVTGYWLGTLTGSLWQGDELAARISGTNLTRTEKGTFQGDVIGVYNENAWEALSVGVYFSEPLTHVSLISALFNTPVKTSTTRNEGYFEYNKGTKLDRRYRYYYYEDNKAGFYLDTVYDNREEIESRVEYYYADGEYRRGDYDGDSDKWTYTTGKWDPETDKLSDLVSNPPEPLKPGDIKFSSSMDYNYLDLTKGGNFSLGLLGGTDAIVWGQSSGATLIGEYHPDADLSKFWLADICSRNYEEAETPPTTYEDGSYYGCLLGYSQQPAKGKFIALYVDLPDKLEVSRAGYLYGDFDGVTYSDISMFNLEGDLFAKQMTLDAGILPVNLPGSIVSNSLIMSGSGSFVDGGEIQALVRGESFNISGQDWGIWAAFMNGTYTEPEKMISQNWGFALGGGSQKSGYSIGSVIGDKWTNGALSGEFKGVSFANDNEIGALRAMTATGWLDGQYIEVDPGVGTWSAASAGEWVEVTELLTPQQLGFDIADMDKFVSVPITEVYSSIMTGTTILPAGTLSLAMDLSLYATSQAAVDGLWAALVSGNYSGTVNPGWAVTVNSTAPGDASAVTVTNTQWADNQWLANVNGAAGGNSISGQAGGQYGDGALTGAGAGTWSAPE